jgi:hypothetical protein
LVKPAQELSKNELDTNEIEVKAARIITSKVAKKRKSPHCCELSKCWWPGAESNCRHADFQSAALPTELPGLILNQSANVGFVCKSRIIANIMAILQRILKKKFASIKPFKNA